MWKYTKYSDLLSSQIEETRLSYNSHSGKYAIDWEWNEDVSKITRHDYLDPFVKHVKKGGVVLVVGCGTGRDLYTLASMGYRYLGIDSSEGMINEAVENRGVEGPVIISEIESMNLAPNSFDGILIDSALEHVKKEDIQNILENVFFSLKKGGTVLLRFRVGKGNVFVVEDSVGIRYFTSYLPDESKKLVKDAGFKIVDSYITRHLDNLRPGFHAYILRK